MPLLRILIVLCLACVTGTSPAQIYKWTDAQGHLHYGDHPSTGGQAEVVTPQINTYTSVEIVGSDTNGSRPVGGHPAVRMYSTGWCGVCKQARAYFSRNHIPFTDTDVENTEAGRRAFKDLHGRGVPIILVGNQRMNGFDAGSFEALYNGV